MPEDYFFKIRLIINQDIFNCKTLEFLVKIIVATM